MEKQQGSCRIAIVAPSAPPSLTGGTSSAHWNLYLALKDAGYSVNVFTFDETGCRGRVEGDVIRHGPSATWRSVVEAAGRLYRIALQLLEGPSDHAYQLVYVLTSLIGARRTNRSLRSFHPDVLILPDNGAPGYFIKPPPGCRTIFISHHNFLRFIDDPLIGNFSQIDAKLAMYFERRTIARMDAVVCPSQYMKGVFANTHKFQRSVDVIPNIVDQHFIAGVPAIDMHQLLGISRDSPIVYIPSAGTRFKGSRFVFEIIRRLSASHRVVGFYLSGAIADEVLREELKYAPDNAAVHCPGSASYSANIAMIKGCSLCISPTLVENFGMAILEANFCGLPVVTFNVGGNAEIITDGENGLLVPFLDVEKLVSGAIALIDSSRIAEMRTTTLLLVNRQFAADKIADQYVPLLVAGNSGASAAGGITRGR